MSVQQEAGGFKLFTMDQTAGQRQTNAGTCSAEVDSDEQGMVKLLLYCFPSRDHVAGGPLKENQLNPKFKWTDVRWLQYEHYAKVFQ